ncbi:MAG: hypothetical protein HY332_21300 [Chloroflexi bacterium]|nr:hypothetical protein [Chloroflexota bacterium]
MTEKKMVNVRLNPGLWTRVKAAAGEQGTTLERWVTEALEAHLSRHAAGKDGVSEPNPELQRYEDLSWRVAALEGAIDYLANAIGAGLPGGTAPNAAATPDTSDAADPNGAGAAERPHQLREAQRA